MTARGRGDAGAGTTLMVAVIGFGGLLICLTLALGQAVVTRHRSAAAADLAALAAASSLTEGMSGAQACAVAGALADANGGAVVGCAIGPGGDVTVRVEIELVDALLAGLPPSGVSSRAGPG